MTEWISVKDALPEDEGQVLAFYHFSYPKIKYMGVLTYFAFDSEPHWQHEKTGLVVTHWMPLPETPKEEEDDG